MKNPTYIRVGQNGHLATYAAYKPNPMGVIDVVAVGKQKPNQHSWSGVGGVALGAAAVAIAATTLGATVQTVKAASKEDSQGGSPLLMVATIMFVLSFLMMLVILFCH